MIIYRNNENSPRYRRGATGRILMKKLFGLVAVAAFAATTFGATTVAAEPLKIRISWAVAPAHLTPLIPHAPAGVYRHYGKSYVVEPIRIAGSGPALQALAAGEVDMSGLSAQALVLGATRAKLDLKVVAQLMSQGVGEYPSSDFFARKGEIKSLKELKGKTIAVNARGSTIDAAVQRIMAKEGFEDGRDYRIVEIRFGAMFAALESKRVDVAPLLQPFNLLAERKGNMEPVFSIKDALGATQTLQYISRASWVAANRAALVDFFEDHLRYRRWLLDPANRDQALKILSELTKQPVKNYEDWAFTKKGYYYDPDGISDSKLLQKNIEDLKEMKILPTSIDVQKYTDMSLVQEAKKRIK
jgi:sulfonate transport system substrate-binding protein